MLIYKFVSGTKKKLSHKKEINQWPDGYQVENIKQYVMLII